MYEELIKALLILQISDYNNLEMDQIKFQYTNLSKIYHPDSAKLNEYKDGKKFIELSNAYRYLVDNFNKISSLPKRGYVSESQHSEFNEYFNVFRESKDPTDSFQHTFNPNPENPASRFSQLTLLMYLGLLSIVLMFIGIFNLPYGYYTFLRFVIFCISGYSLYSIFKINLKSNLQRFSVPLILILILWNPIFPITMDKGSWVFFDIIAIIFFGIFTYKVSTS